MTIGTLIKTKRTNLGLTQKRLAGMAALTSRQVYNIEQNVSSPTLTTLSRLVNALEIEPDELMAAMASEAVDA